MVKCLKTRSGTSLKIANKKAFTLIELLVVIAIISLLVSILLPSLNKAKDLARSVVCMSNLRQFHVIFSYYAEDNSGLIPPGDPAPSGSPNQWHVKLLPYIDNSFSIDDAGRARTASGDVVNNVHTQGSDLYQCPSVKNRTWPGWPDYKLNIWMYMNRGRGGVSCASLHNMTHPTRRMILTETSKTSWYASPASFTPPRIPDGRHMDNCNQMYADGHAAEADAESLAGDDEKWYREDD